MKALHANSNNWHLQIVKSIVNSVRNAVFHEVFVFFSFFLLSPVIIVNSVRNAVFHEVFVFFSFFLLSPVIICFRLLSPQKRGIMFLPALVCLSVCLFVTTITK